MSSRAKRPTAGPGERPLSGASVAAGTLAVALGVNVLARLLEAMSLASILAQAILVEWVSGHLGVAWTARDAKPSLPRRIATGSMVGALVISVVALFTASTRAALFVRQEPAIAMIAVAFVTAALEATRDELLLRGLPLRALDGVSNPVVRVLACGCLGAASALGQARVTPESVIIAFVLGLAFSAAWLRDRGAWFAVSAHTAWLFGGGLLFDGGLFRAHVAVSRWGGGAAGILNGGAAVVAMLPLATCALAWAALATGRTGRVR